MKARACKTHLRTQTAPRQGVIGRIACAHDGNKLCASLKFILEAPKCHTVRPPWPFFNDVITAYGWGTKVAALESELLGSHVEWPSGAIASVLRSSGGHRRLRIDGMEIKWDFAYSCVRTVFAFAVAAVVAAAAA